VHSGVDEPRSTPNNSALGPPVASNSALGAPVASNSTLGPPPAVNVGSVGPGKSISTLGPGGSSSDDLFAMSGSRDGTASRIAGGQRTLLTTAQLTRCGIGKDAVAYRMKSGRLHLVFHGVYSFGCEELPPLARELAALLAVGEGAFLSHRSAAFFWGMRKTAPAPVEVSVIGRSCSSRDGIRVHRIRAIDRREMLRKDGFWVSSPERAVLEVAAVAPDELVDMFDEGFARRRLNLRELDAVLARNRPCRGASRLAAMLGDGTGITRSRAERAFLKLIRDSGLPRPEANVKFGPYVPDFIWRRERLIVEIDSPTFHAGPRAFENDRDKDLFYRDARFDVLRFTRKHVVTRGPMVLVTVAQTLARLTASA
jgi:very-short-patch-repair endonuclease